jgi:hypothetical protein
MRNMLGMVLLNEHTLLSLKKIGYQEDAWRDCLVRLHSRIKKVKQGWRRSVGVYSPSYLHALALVLQRMM